MVRDHDAVDRLGRVAGPPADRRCCAFPFWLRMFHTALQSPREIGHRLDAEAVGRGLGKAVDAVLERPLAGGDGGPQHRRERRMERGDLADRRRCRPAAARSAFCRASISGLMTFQSAASQPITRTLAFRFMVSRVGVWLRACLGIPQTHLSRNVGGGSVPRCCWARIGGRSRLQIRASFRPKSQFTATLYDCRIGVKLPAPGQNAAAPVVRSARIRLLGSGTDADVAPASIGWLGVMLQAQSIAVNFVRKPGLAGSVHTRRIQQ